MKIGVSFIKIINESILPENGRVIISFDTSVFIESSKTVCPHYEYFYDSILVETIDESDLAWGKKGFVKCMGLYADNEDDYKNNNVSASQKYLKFGEIEMDIKDISKVGFSDMFELGFNEDRSYFELYKDSIKISIYGDKFINATEIVFIALE